MKIHNKLIKSKQVAENTDLCGNFIHYNFDQNGPPYQMAFFFVFAKLGKGGANLK